MRRPALRIGTRNSPLARWQAAHVARRLHRAHPELRLIVLPMTAVGDNSHWTPPPGTDIKASFVHQLEQAIQAKQLDCAVHSIKDMSHTPPAGLALAAVCERGDVRDALVSNARCTLDALADDARLGTGSLRRRFQLRHHRNALRMLPMRGNVQTRLNKLARGDCDALVLAAAGLERLGLAGRIDHYLPVELCLPAAGQAAIGVEARADDHATRERLAALHHEASARQVCAERACIRALNGGCHTPIAAYAWPQGTQLTLRARVGAEDGSRLLDTQLQGSEPEALGEAVAQRLLAAGAAELLA